MSDNEMVSTQDMTEIESTLVKYLKLIVSIDPSMNEIEQPTEEKLACLYETRNNLVQRSVILAQDCGYKAGFAVHQPIQQLLPEMCGYSSTTSGGKLKPEYKKDSKPEWDIRWGVVAYIELPTGQISWHLDSGGYEWDDHNNEDKRNRVDDFILGLAEEGLAWR